MTDQHPWVRRSIADEQFGRTHADTRNHDADLCSLSRTEERKKYKAPTLSSPPIPASGRLIQLQRQLVEMRDSTDSIAATVVRAPIREAISLKSSRRGAAPRVYLAHCRDNPTSKRYPAPHPSCEPLKAELGTNHRWYERSPIPTRIQLLAIAAPIIAITAPNEFGANHHGWVRSAAGLAGCIPDGTAG